MAKFPTLLPPEDVVTMDDVSKLFQKLMDFVKQAKTGLEALFSEHRQKVSTELNSFAERLKTAEKTLSEGVSKGKEAYKELIYSESRTLMRLIEQKVKDLEDQIPSAYDDGDIRTQIENVKKLIPVVPPQFDASTIFADLAGIIGRVEDIDKRVKDLAARPVGGGGVRRVFQPYLVDVSSDCDGANKTFYLTREPLRTDTIEVHCTDFPIILRPDVDFTVSGKAVILTSAVAAPSSGATMLIKFYA